MAGQVLELLPRTAFDFTYLGTGGQEARVLVGKIPTAAWSSGTLMVRLHNSKFENSGSKITTQLVLDASTPSDPEHAFVDQDAITGASVEVDSQTQEARS